MVAYKTGSFQRILKSLDPSCRAALVYGPDAGLVAERAAALSDAFAGKRAASAPWSEMQDAAEQHYDRSADCVFTTFVGYEWTGMERYSGGNLHRNVVFRNAQVPELPVTFIDEPRAENLWRRLDEQCNQAEGRCDSLAIPHNSNLSAGQMFSGLRDDGSEMNADYARRRQRFEPLLEIMQKGGSSECFFAAGTTTALVFGSIRLTIPDTLPSSDSRMR